MEVFASLPEKTRSLLEELEQKDREERNAELPKEVRLRQIPRVTGLFLYHLLLTHVPRFGPTFNGLEVGTSGGYSTIWQALSLSHLGFGLLQSLDVDPSKTEMAQRNISAANLGSYVRLQNEDLGSFIASNLSSPLHYVFLDAEKEDYVRHFQLVKPKLVRGGLLVADNVVSHGEDMKDFLTLLPTDPDVMASIIDVGKGLALVTKL